MPPTTAQGILAPMHRPALSRRLAAVVAIAALVFAQALVAAHACMIPAPADAAAAAPCHDTDEPARDALCKVHCEAGTQTVDQAKPLALPDAGAPPLVLRAANLAPPPAVTAVRLTDWLAHAGAPPPLLLHRRLRI
jgi:hypothetical protein